MKREKRRKRKTYTCALLYTLLFLLFISTSLLLLFISGGNIMVTFGSLVVNLFQFIFSIREDGFFPLARKKCLINPRGKCVSCTFAALIIIGFSMISAYYSATLTLANGKLAISTLEEAPDNIIDATFLKLLNVQIPKNMTTTMSDPRVTPISTHERYYCISPIFQEGSDLSQERKIYAWAGVILEDIGSPVNSEACNNAIFYENLSPSWKIHGNVTTISYDSLCRLESFWYSSGAPTDWTRVRDKAIHERNFSSVSGAPILQWGTDRKIFEKKAKSLLVLLILIPSLLCGLWLASLFSIYLWNQNVSNSQTP